MDLILNLLHIDPAQFSNLMPMLVLAMGILSGINMIISAIAKFANNNFGGSFMGYISKALEYGQKFIDFISGNVKH